MAATSTPFSNEKAPCGQVVSGERLRDRDEQCLVADEMFFACGCRRLRNEYHDGSVSLKVVHHNGKVLVDELDGAS